MPFEWLLQMGFDQHASGGLERWAAAQIIDELCRRRII